jgi:hypothetical protein
MPADPYEEWKRYWELKLLEAQVDKILDERDKMRLDIAASNKRWELDLEESRRRWDKYIKDSALDEKRFKVQVWTTIIGGLGAIVAGAGVFLTWWTTHAPH